MTNINKKSDGCSVEEVINLNPKAFKQPVAFMKIIGAKYANRILFDANIKPIYGITFQ